MPLILPGSYPHKQFISKMGINCREEAVSESVRIGILNLMPEAEKYEPSVLVRLGRHPSFVMPVFIRSEIHNYSSSNKHHLRTFYKTFNEAIKDGELNGLIITGAPVEKLEYSAVRYWKELSDLMQYSWDNFKGTMGLCWGGLAMGKFLGIEKNVFEEKIFGVFPSVNLDPKHIITGSAGNPFYCPQSRYAGFKEDELAEASGNGKIELLAFAEGTGHFIFSAKAKNFIAHIGHPEYTVERILFEYNRDQHNGLNTVPSYFDPAMPEYSWETSGTEFFTNWVESVR